MRSWRQLITHTSCRAAGRCHQNTAVCQQNWQYRAAERERERKLKHRGKDGGGKTRTETVGWSGELKIPKYRKTREDVSTEGSDRTQSHFRVCDKTA